ncbi:MAG: hypothetical protein ACQKBU_11690 [Verrucomicrobiales bacterium]
MKKITPEDPRLSAYVLGELSADEAAAVDRASATDPAVRIALRETERTMNFLRMTLGGGDEHRLLPRQRRQVIQAGRDEQAVGKLVELPSAKRSPHRWLTGLAAAAAVAFAALLLSRFDGVRSGAGEGWSEAIALLPMPGPEVGGGMVHPARGGHLSAERSEQLRARGNEFLSEVARELEQIRLPKPETLPAPGALDRFAAQKELRVPVLIGDTSPRWVNRWLNEHTELPPAELVRVEEFINSVTLSSEFTVGSLQVGAETVPNPWRSDSWLVAVQLRTGEAGVDHLTVHSLASGPRRVLGSFVEKENAALPSFMPAEHATLIMLEFASEDLGSLVVTHEGGSMEWDLVAEESGCSPEMARAVVMGAYALWLREELNTDGFEAAMRFASKSNPGALPRELIRQVEQALAFRSARR